MSTVPRPRSKAEREAAKKAATEEATPGTTGTPEKTPKLSGSRTTTTDVKLRESVKGMYEGVAMLAMGIGMTRQDQRLLQFAGTLMEPPGPIPVMNHDQTAFELVPAPDQRTGAEKIADAWMTAADRNPKVKQYLRKVTEGGAFAEVLALHVTLLIPFLPGIPFLSALTGAAAPQAGEGPVVPGDNGHAPD